MKNKILKKATKVVPTLCLTVFIPSHTIYDDT